MNKELERDLWVAEKLHGNSNVETDGCNRVRVRCKRNAGYFFGKLGHNHKSFSLSKAADREAAVIWLGEEHGVDICALIICKTNEFIGWSYDVLSENIDNKMHQAQKYELHKEALYAGIDYLMGLPDNK